MDEGYRYRKPTSIWSEKIKKAEKSIAKSNLSKEEKELINHILKDSQNLMNDLEHNSWKTIFARQTLELVLKLGAFYHEAEKLIPLEGIDKKIKAADKSRMWNSIVIMNMQLNMLMQQLGGSEFYDIYGRKTNEHGEVIKEKE